MCATSTQSNEDTQVLQRDHMLRLLAPHDRSVHDTFFYKWATDSYSAAFLVLG